MRLIICFSFSNRDRELIISPVVLSAIDMALSVPSAPFLPMTMMAASS